MTIPILQMAKHIRAIGIASACLCLLFLTSACETTQQGIPAKQLIANLRQVKIGYSSEQVVALIGRPARVNNSLSAAGSNQQWVYTDSQFRTPGQALLVGMAAGAGNTAIHEGQLYLNFSNNKLTSMQSVQ